MPSTWSPLRRAWLTVRLLLIDPSGSISTDAQGNVVLPLAANPHFGKLLIRRGEGRVVGSGFGLGTDSMTALRTHARLSRRRPEPRL